MSNTTLLPFLAIPSFPSQPLPTMYATRSSRRTNAVAVPDFHTIIRTIEASGRESVIRDQVAAVAKFYRTDPDQVLGFWFQQSDAVYDLNSEVHLTLLKCILASLPDYGHPVTRHFLHNFTRPQLQTLGVQRHRRDDAFFYRILVGDRA